MSDDEREWAAVEQWAAEQRDHEMRRLPSPVVPIWHRDQTDGETFAHQDGQWATTEHPNERYL